MPRCDLQLVYAVFLSLLIVPLLIVAKPAAQNAESNDNAAKPGVAIVTSVRVVHDQGLAAIEVVSSLPVVPAIKSLDSPPRVVIELKNARSVLQQRRLEVLQGNILTIRTEQSQKNPPVVRIVVNLLVPHGYEWDGLGSRLIVRLKPPEDPYAASRKAPAPEPSQQLDQQSKTVLLVPGAEPAMVPVSSGVGEVLLAGRRFAAGSSLTAGSETAVLQLSRGGEIRVCPGTTLSVTPSKTADELMMGLSTGAMEAHYALGAAADTVLTPDFRILFAGPGEFHYAISTDSKGDTCVRGLRGNTSSAIVSELIGDRVYQVKPAEQAVFHSGQIDKIGTDVPLECGCPPPPPVMRAEASQTNLKQDSDSPEITMAHSGSPDQSEMPNAAREGNQSRQTLSSGPETRPLPPRQRDEVQIQVEAPLVFHANPMPAAEIEEAMALPVVGSSARMIPLEVQPLPPSPALSDARPQHRGIFRRIGGFFAAIFR